MSRDQGAPINVLYVGLHPETPGWIAGEKFRIVGVADIGEYFYHFTLAPGDLAFCLAYYLYERNVPVLKRWAYIMWKILQPFSTKVYRRYAPYLECIANENSRVIDLSDVPRAGTFIKDHDVDLVIVNCWSILPHALIALPSLGTVNIHPSRLPLYRGALPTLWALKNGDRSSAVTVLLVTMNVDGGKVLAQYDFNIGRDDDALAIERTIDTLLSGRLRTTLDLYVQGMLTPALQEGVASTTDKYDAYRQIFFCAENAVDIVNKCQLYPHIEPRLYCYFNSSMGPITLKSASLDDSKELSPGSFVVRGASLLVGAKNGCVRARLFADMKWRASIRLWALHRQGSLLSSGC